MFSHFSLIFFIFCNLTFYRETDDDRDQRSCQPEPILPTRSSEPLRESFYANDYYQFDAHPFMHVSARTFFWELYIAFETALSIRGVCVISLSILLFFIFFIFIFFWILMTVHGRCSWRLCMSRGCNREQSVPRCSRIFFRRSVACYLRSEGDDEAHSFATFGKVKKFPLKDISAIWKEIRIF